MQKGWFGEAQGERKDENEYQIKKMRGEVGTKRECVVSSRGKKRERT